MMLKIETVIDTNFDILKTLPCNFKMKFNTFVMDIKYKWIL